jgi:threonine dehydratase/serine racemase
VLCAPNLAARETTAAAVQAETGATLVPPYDHPDIIAGQGTAGLELHAQAPDLDAVVVPVGGGGLVSGVALALRDLAPDVHVFAAEPAGADDAARSRAEGRLIPQTAPNTVADGLRTSLGEHTWPVVRDVVHDVLVVDDDAILDAMRLVWTRLKQVVEPSAAVPLAAVLHGLPARYRHVGIVLSGGNVDPEKLPWT